MFTMQTHVNLITLSPAPFLSISPLSRHPLSLSHSLVSSPFVIYFSPAPSSLLSPPSPLSLALSLSPLLSITLFIIFHLRFSHPFSDAYLNPLSPFPGSELGPYGVRVNSLK